jgi:hypothetical protein
MKSNCHWNKAADQMNHWKQEDATFSLLDLSTKLKKKNSKNI